MVHYQILTASYTNDVYTLTFDPNASTIEVTSSVTVGFHPSWIASYLGDSSLIFTGLEQPDGKIIVVKYDEDGNGKVVAEAPSGGAAPCSLLATADQLLVANYSSGIFSLFPISSEPPYLLATEPITVQLSGSGPNPDRQGSSHPHQVFLHPEHGELLIPDLGADKTWRFVKGDDGTWTNEGHINYPAGSGPRHLATHGGSLYTLLELTSSIARHDFPLLPTTPTLAATVPTLSNPPPTPNDMLAAEILIPPTNTTYPTAYIYVSNRNDPSPDGDTIAIFAVDTLELVAEVRTGMQHIRGILFGGPDDKWLIAGGVNDGGVKIFERIDEGRNLRVIASNEDVRSPTGFLWV